MLKPKLKDRRALEKGQESPRKITNIRSYFPADLPRVRSQCIYKELKCSPPRNPIPLSKLVILKKVKYVQTKSRRHKGGTQTRKRDHQGKDKRS